MTTACLFYLVLGALQKKKKKEEARRGGEGSILLCSLRATRLEMFTSQPEDEKWQAEIDLHHGPILTHVN